MAVGVPDLAVAERRRAGGIRVELARAPPDSEAAEAAAGGRAADGWGRAGTLRAHAAPGAPRRHRRLQPLHVALHRRYHR